MYLLRELAHILTREKVLRVVFFKLCNVFIYTEGKNLYYKMLGNTYFRKYNESMLPEPGKIRKCLTNTDIQHCLRCTGNFS